MRKHRAILVGSIWFAAASGLALAGCSSKGSGSAAIATSEPPPVIAPPPVPATRVYTLNHAGEGSPNLMLTRVTVEAKATKLDVTMKNVGRNEFTMAVSEAGSDHAMFLQLPDGKKLAFRSATDIAVNPERTKIKPNTSVSFTMIFEPLDPGTTRFDVYEGEDAKDPAMKKKKNLWLFRNVELK